MKNIFEKTRIVLIGTTHPGNIGAAARAMKTMSQEKLYLVSPKTFPSAEATARATGADDILASATVCASLKEAISDCDLVIGTSARTRSLPWPMQTPRECAETVSDNKYSSVALVFGRENSGLSNEELELCNLVMQIPTNAEYSSLNLASAVQIICYELYLLAGCEIKNETDEDNSALVSQDKIEMFYQHLEKCLIDIDFYDIDNPRLLMHRMRRLFNRTQLEENECNILRGILSKVQEKIK
ncbi:MAG: RNA methyltransferase [Proteobacteria bacterium]|nr:RNA methyltransferase [Pseudomonadota bacterium]NOG60127.1 RNA methyltransferase [Pseudomonadota bacterium]